MDEKITNEETRICEWCSKSMPKKALKCSHCKEWRKDIQKDVLKAYVSAAAIIVPFIFFYGGLRNGWWHKGNWFELKFSVTAFLTSLSGSIILVSFVITVLIARSYANKLKKKIEL